MRAPQQRRSDDAAKVKALRAEIKAGVDALARGEFVDVEERALDHYLDELVGPSAAMDAR
jgi:antitoxin ParD1/3/4